MKHNDIKGITKKILTVNMENIFNVYVDDKMLNDKYFYNILKTIIIPDDIDDIYYEKYTVTSGDTWTNLAYRFYGQVEAWWIICVTNGIMDPTSLPQTGNVLKILTRNAARQILTTINEK